MKDTKTKNPFTLIKFIRIWKYLLLYTLLSTNALYMRYHVLQIQYDKHSEGRGELFFEWIPPLPQ
jgi:hypothetical protein